MSRAPEDTGQLKIAGAGGQVTGAQPVTQESELCLPLFCRARDFGEHAQQIPEVEWVSQVSEIDSLSNGIAYTFWVLTIF